MDIIIIRPHCSITYIDVAYCYRQSSVICLYAMIMSPAKTTEPIKMQFGMLSQVGLRNHVLDGMHIGATC